MRFCVWLAPFFLKIRKEAVISVERWYWIELIGFDNEAEDYGVGAFLSRNVSTAGVSLLFSHIDFIFEQENEALAPTACSYGGHEYNRERRRQNWTKTQLRGLIDELHRRGVKVFFSTFDMTKGISDPNWVCLGVKGLPEPLIYVLKKGVGEAVIERISEVLDFYGFDGLQLADGLSSNRRSVAEGDFSLELCADSGINIPRRLMKEGTEAYAARREWILKNAEFRWIRYLSDLWANFYSMLFEKIKKPIMFNNAWTRNSFEAIYRYRRCRPHKAFAVMVEENSATRGITACPEDEGRVTFPEEYRNTFPYEYTLMQQDIKLITGGLRQISLMPISDTQEQWDALRHCPTELVRSTVRRYNNFVWRDGRFEECCNAPHYCLSDGIPAEDWAWLAKQESYRIPPPDMIDGFAAVVNHGALWADVERFCKKRCYYGAALLGELACGGLNMSAQLPLCEAAKFDRAKCLVVTDLCVYTEDQKRMLAAAKLPILAVGEDVELPLEKKAYYEGKYVSVALYGDAPHVDIQALRALDVTVRRGRYQRGAIWTEPLQYKRVKGEFFTRLCYMMNGAFGADRCDRRDVKVNSYICGDVRYTLLSNDLHTYNLATAETGAPVETAEALMKEKGYEVKVNGDRFTVRIPPRCVEIVKTRSFKK